MRVRKLTFTALALAAGLSLTACNGDDSAAQSSGTSASSASSAGSGSAEGSGQDSAGKSATGQGTATGTGSDTDAAAGNCSTDALEVTATDATIGGDTEGTVAVTFKNGGGQDCTLSGYAGVDLKTNAGDLSAERTGQDSDPVTLADGESVSFGITYPVNDSGGSGVRITGLVVTPPNETKSVTLDWPGAASLPVTDGSGATVKVGPMGSAGQGGAS
ncbi:DUF4232 domain-containing protein [Streptomyces sp. ISL-12]|uniref:DUF4232 domain-containing protein n=1 Tax=Streptomyces sp. ISL-12 TaxID=2819177 RepID=UPI001BED3C86|nr:DUF4232 domain-containing protein [Streptomyces sp. ISL-12]MBT2410437.1 DUF4232 domain-containing protein [Streptomyces sp. ISL-12]